MSQEKGIQQNRSTAIAIVTTKTVITIGIGLMTGIVVNIKAAQVTKNILDTENAPMTNVDITGTTIIRGAAMTITDIGGPGSNGIDMQKSTLTYTNMEDITAKADT